MLPGDYYTLPPCCTSTTLVAVPVGVPFVAAKHSFFFSLRLLNHFNISPVDLHWLTLVVSLTLELMSSKMFLETLPNCDLQGLISLKSNLLGKVVLWSLIMM